MLNRERKICRCMSTSFIKQRIGRFHVVVVQKCTKKQRNCFADKTNCFLTLSLLKVPFVDLCLCSQSSQLSLRRTPLVPTPRVRLRESQIKGFKNGMDQFWVSVLPRCPSYRELNKGSQERQGPTLGVRLTEVSVL